MTECERCGTALEPSWKFCIRCGAPTRVRRQTFVPLPAREAATPGSAAPSSAAPPSAASTSTAPAVPEAEPAVLPGPEAQPEPEPTPDPTADPFPLPSELRRFDPTAVLALVLGLVFSPFAAVFGIVALVRLRNGRARGRLMAIAGIALGVGWTGMLAVVLVALLQGRV